MSDHARRSAPTLICLLVALAVGGHQQAFADQRESIDQPYLPLLETLIDHVGEGRIEDAMGVLEDQTSKGVPEDKREQLKRTMAAIYAGAGEYDGQDFVAVQAISPRLHRVHAVAYFERQPVIYTFTMYQFGGKWVINHVHWGDDVVKLAELIEKRIR